MQQKNVALLFNPSEPGIHETVSQFASHARAECSCLPLPVDRHLPGRVEELSIDAAVNLVGDLELASEVTALCRLLDLPVTGPSGQAQQICADRALLKDFLAIHNLASPAGYLVRNPVENLAQEHRNFGFPVRVLAKSGLRPATVAHDLDELKMQVLAARCEVGEVLVERLVTGTVVCTALWRRRAVGSAEIQAVTEASGACFEEIRIPARVPATGLKTMERLAERLAELFHADQAMLVTSVRNEQQEEYLLDIDLMPSLHRHSRFGRIASAFGLSQGECVRSLVGDLRSHRSVSLATRSAWMCG
jgi:D-alanine-D-alanine ligase-like ATP-grasp enzyme